MKYRLFLVAALAAVMVSCEKENREIAEAGEAISTINATWAESETKTVLGEDGTSILWSANDEISVFYNEDGVKFTSINSKPKDRVIFKSSYSLIYGGTETSSEPYLYGIYPYSAANAQEGEVLTLTVPAEQKAIEGSFARGAFPSIARSKDTNMAFYNVCGGVRFTLCQSGITKIIFSGNNDESLAGKVKVQFGQDGKPELSAVVSGEKTITLTAPDGGEFQTGKWYYISVLPTILSKGFSMTFFKRTDFSESGSRTVASSIAVKRSIFGSIENADSDVSYKVSVASLSISPTDVLVAPMSAVQLSVTVLPVDAEYELKWSSSDKTIATVDEDGMVTGKKDGKCTVTATADNGITASCTIYVSQTPVTTNDASQIGIINATLNGSFNVIGTESVSKSVSFLYSATETTAEGLKANGIKLTSSLNGNDFSAVASNLSDDTRYYYIAVLKFCGKDFVGDVKAFTTNAYQKPDAVDLGLSVKWASFNMGATKPEDYGGYYQWAGTQDVTSTSIYLDWNNCPYHLTGNSTSSGWTKYIPSGKSSYWSGSGSPDNKTVLDPDDDVAVRLGGKWRMPTDAEWSELKNNCTWTWKTQNGVKGRLVTGPNGNSIFLPAAGYRSNFSLYNAGSYGSYWSSSLDTDYPSSAFYVYFDSDDVGRYYGLRYYGQSVRPVTE